MNSEQPTLPSAPIDYSKPVAYDSNGQPLYAREPAGVPPPQPDGQVTSTIHVANTPSPLTSEEVAVRHNRSIVTYSFLNLSAAEYVVREVHRSPIGLASVVGTGGGLVVLLLAGLFSYPQLAHASATSLPAFDSIVLPALLLMTLITLITYIAATIYLSNRFFLTNESIIQEIQAGLFQRNEQTISLANIEDTSYTQAGLLQTMFGYGTIRLSTVGHETIYRFTYVTNPKEQLAILSNAIEAFKNGRPVTG